MEKVPNFSKRRKQPVPEEAASRTSGGVATPTPITAPFVIMRNGRVLLNIAHCDGRALEGRRIYTFTGILLTPDEAKLARAAARDITSEDPDPIAAGMRTAWTLPRPEKHANDRSPSRRYRAPRKGKAARP